MINLEGIKCILFDLDNTLWDFDGNAEIALSQLYISHGLENLTGKPDSVFIETYAKVNASYWRKYEKGEIDKERLRTQRFIDSLSQLGLPEELQPKGLWKEYLEICPTIPNLIPGAINVLARLKEHFKIGLLTNGFEETQKRKIKYSGIDQHIHFMLSSEKFGSPKPAKGIFDEAMKIAKIKHEECIYIGDNRETDVLGGLGAGIKTAWFKHSNDPEVKHPLFLGEFAILEDFADFILNSQKR